ncbi:uncharacterized protein LOC131148308 [Malania oleifera]|uniref:uncharacterized protein LOC131148308 n=1 Tax=Malania oleifera TaxID=397392 RepID=UPI0025AE23FB|nr:uncharacterized protein LOC131148308 [Malania oleifera]
MDISSAPHSEDDGSTKETEEEEEGSAIEVAPTSKVATETDEAKEELEETSSYSKKSVNMKGETRKEYRLVAPYPQRLMACQKNKYHNEIQEIFEQVKINILLLDAIQQVPSYAKFLKDLCTVKRKLNVKKKDFLTEQLGLGELKKTSMLLQLAYISLKFPRGVIEDVLVQVDKFYNPVVIVVLDMQQPVSNIYQAPIILGWPFLATSNALINCRSEVLKLTFRNTTVDMNVFNARKMTSGCHDLELYAVDVVDDLDISELLSTIDSNGAFESYSFEQPEVFDEKVPLIRELLESKRQFTKIDGSPRLLDASYTSSWRKPTFETLDLPEVMKSSVEEVLTLELKPLLEDLKYVFLGPAKRTFPAVISSRLTLKQEN